MSHINNLNVFTFIKDIYQALKNIDIKFNDTNKILNDKIIQLEDRQNTIIEKLNNIEILLQKINENSTAKIGIDKELENELLKKINILNTSGNNDKIDLKPDELTFANILENGYTFIDINESLAKSPTIPKFENKHSNMNFINNAFNLDINVDYENKLNIYSGTSPEHNINNNNIENINKNNKTENIETLLF